VKTYKGKITLSKNSRGCYILDTVKGCSVCRDQKPMGCYDNCYALRIADRYRFDFTSTVNRGFERDYEQIYMFDASDQHHMGQIVSEIKNATMPFIRIGEMGDPSYDWEHTIRVCEQVSIAGKPIVIITKHWEVIPDDMLNRIACLDICINTSVSALDNGDEIQHRVEQYERLKQYCNSALRVVTCDFNIDSREGLDREIMQQWLLSKDNIIETAFRPDKDNRFITDGVISVKPVQFLGTKCLGSMRSDDIFLGYCHTCPDMCGIIYKKVETSL
jgi:hypothetical protein